MEFKLKDSEIEIDFKVDRRLSRARLYRGSDGSVEVRSPTSLSKRSKISIINQIENGKIKLPPSPGSVEYPNAIFLPLLHQSYSVAYMVTSSDTPRLEIRGSQIMVTAKSDHDVDRLLGGALKKIARKPLTELLRVLLLENSQQLQKIRIGLPSGRWASRSSSGTISLSARLMLIEEELIRGVMLHEIAHIKHMNHSKDFYDHLEEIDPNYRQRRRSIKEEEVAFAPWIRKLR